MPERIVARHIFQLVKEGDRSIIKTIEEIGYYLGLAVVNIINFSDPELVVLCGYMIYESGELLLNIIKKVVEQHIVNGKSRKVRIEKGALGENAALIGAATLIYQDIFTLSLEYP